jgi:hypothetical protein
MMAHCPMIKGLHRLIAGGYRQHGIETPMLDLARCHVATNEISRAPNRRGVTSGQMRQLKPVLALHLVEP